MDAATIYRRLREQGPQPADWAFYGWYRKVEGCWTGPLADVEVVHLVRSGELRPSDRLMEVWKSGDTARRSYRTVAEALGKK
jgi:hypothetical protein